MVKEFLDKLITEAKNRTPTNIRTVNAIAVLFLVSLFFTKYNTNQVHDDRYLTNIFYIFIFIDSLILWIYFLKIKTAKNEFFAVIFWNFSIFSIAFILGTFFVLVNHANRWQIVIYIFNLMVSFILLSWRLSIVMLVSSVLISVQIYKYYIGINQLEACISDSQFMLLYTLLFLTSVLFIFLRPNQELIEKIQTKIKKLKQQNSSLTSQVEYYDQTVKDQKLEIERLGSTAQKILNKVNHETRIPASSVLNFADMLDEALKNSNYDSLQELCQEIHKNSYRLSTMVINMVDLAALEVKKINLKKEKHDLSAILKNAIINSKKQNLKNKEIEFIENIEKNIFVNIDIRYFRQIFDNLIINAIDYSDSGTIEINLKKDKKNISFSIKDQGIGIPEIELFDIFTPFKMSSKTESRAQGRGLGLSVCKAAIEAHGGHITASSNKKQGTIFKFIIPIS